MAQGVAGKLGGKEKKQPPEQDGNATPEDAPLSEAQKKYGPNYEKLKDMRPEVVAALQQLVFEYRWEAIYAQRARIQRIKYARLFWQEIQYAFWNEGRNDFDFSSANGIQSDYGRDEDSGTGPRFEFTTNWYQGYGLSFCSLVSQDVPNLSIIPKSREVHENITAAKVAQDVVDVVEQNNDPHEMLEAIGRYHWTDGVAFSYSRYVVDGERFGYKTMPKYELGPGPDGMMVPQQTGEEKIPLGQEVIDILGGLEVAAPIFADKFHNYGWLQWNSEPDIAQLKEAYPHAAAGIRADSGSSSETVYERLARLGIKQNTPLVMPGDALAQLPTFSRTWLRKWAFNRIDTEEIRDELKELFPEGAYVAFAGFEYCESRSESMDKHWRVRHALPGDGQNRPAVGGSCISPQERYNVFSNLQTETYEYGIPPIYADSRVLDFDSTANQTSEPAVHVPARARPGMSLQDGFFQPDPAKEPASLSATMTELAGPTMQFLSGMLPAVFGGEMGDVQTASGYAMARDQAMGRLGLIWRGIKIFYAETISLNVEIFKENRPEDVEVPFAGENDEEKAKWIRLIDLKGEIMVKPEPDEGLPRLNSQQRAVLMKVLEMGAAMPPTIAKALEAPENLNWMKTVFGLHEMTIPGEDSDTKQMREIQVLLQSGPQTFPKQPQQVPGPNGQPVIMMIAAPPQPTVPIDELLDDHQLEFQKCEDWANSNLGQQAARENPAGYANFRLHAQMHQQVIAQRQQAALQQQMMLKHPPPKPPAAQPPKGPSESMALKDLPPKGAIQMAAQAGIQLSEDDMQAHQDQQRQDKADELQAKLAAKPAEGNA